MALVKGSWEIQNLLGIPRRFKSAESPEAIEWMSNRETLEQFKASERARRAALPKVPKKKKIAQV